MRFKTYLVACLLGLSSTVYASGGDVVLKDFPLDRSEENLRQGAILVKNNCLLCHELHYLRYRNLLDIGFTLEEVDAWRGNHGIGDRIPANVDNGIVASLFGAPAPDLSLMGKARKGGPNYIYTLMTSFHENEDGSITNPVFSGLSMPDVMEWSVRTDAERKVIEEKMASISAFLEWSADPKAPQRRTMGMYVLIYLIILTVLLYFVKKRVWARLD